MVVKDTFFLLTYHLDPYFVNPSFPSLSLKYVIPSITQYSNRPDLFLVLPKAMIFSFVRSPPTYLFKPYLLFCLSFSF